MPRLEGAVALITGASRGQGAAHARAFVREGAKVVITDVLDDQGSALARTLGENAVFAHLDVSDEESWASAVEVMLESFGAPSVLVNNAGVIRHSLLLEENLEDWQRVLDVNLTGCWLGIRAVAPLMTKGGSIVNVSSNAGLVGFAQVGAYVAAKWGLRGLTKSAALELGGAGIRVNSIHPGVVDTPMLKFDPADSPALRSQPIARAGRPEEIADLVVFLASAEASYVTGAEIAIDGGMVVGSVPPSAT